MITEQEKQRLFELKEILKSDILMKRAEARRRVEEIQEAKRLAKEEDVWNQKIG